MYEVMRYPSPCQRCTFAATPVSAPPGRSWAVWTGRAKRGCFQLRYWLTSTAITASTKARAVIRHAMKRRIRIGNPECSGIAVRCGELVCCACRIDGVETVEWFMSCPPAFPTRSRRASGPHGRRGRSSFPAAGLCSDSVIVAEARQQCNDAEDFFRFGLKQPVSHTLKP